MRFVDRDVVWLNLLFMMPDSVNLVRASVLGEYTTSRMRCTSSVPYSSQQSFLRWVLYRYLMRRPGLLWKPPEIKQRRVGALLAGAPIVVYALAMLVAVAAPTVSLLLYFSMPLLYLLLIAVLRQSEGTRQQGRGLWLNAPAARTALES